MSADRELLELAAKAFWGAEIDDVCSIEWSDADGILYTHAENQDHNGIDRQFRWNPLLENHDALALAVKLQLGVIPFSDDVSATHGPTGREWPEPYGDDPCAATRRAIVRAAAEIGRSTNAS